MKYALLLSMLFGLAACGGSNEGCNIWGDCPKKDCGIWGCPTPKKDCGIWGCAEEKKAEPKCDFYGNCK